MISLRHLAKCAFALALVPGAALSGSSSVLAAHSEPSTNAQSRAQFNRHEVAVGSFMLPRVKAGEPLLYISDWGHGTVSVFSQSQPGAGLIGKIAGLVEPTGIAVDSNHDLWVQSGMGATGTQIEAFHRGETTPYTSFAGGGGVGVTFDSHGNLYVTTTHSEIDVYAPGATQPTQRLYDDKLDSLWAVAVDRNGDVFCEGVVYEFSGPDLYPVDELKKGAKNVQRLIPSLGDEGGLVVLPNQDLLVEDGASIATYAKPYTEPAVSSFNTRDNGASLALSSTFASVWIAAAHGPDGQGQQYNLSSGHLTHWTKHAGMSSVVLGVALDPPST